MAADVCRPPTLGVGVTYVSGLYTLLESAPQLVDVLEVEPQTLWMAERAGEESYVVDEAELRRVRDLPVPKLVHGIGFPVGGTIAPARSHLPELCRTIDLLKPLWISEHLNFNRVRLADREFVTGVLLPPRQTAAGVAAAVRSIREYATATQQPVAVETGVNYLQARHDELPDAEFVAQVAVGADCGILLDLHNLYANEKNGRQTIESFLAGIPLERVWEVHLAGGEERDGYWLDSHCGATPSDLFDLARDVVSALPNLGALIFELFPAYLPSFGVSGVAGELERIRSIWDARSTRRAPAIPPAPSVRLRSQDAIPGPTPAEWERVLGSLVVGREDDSSLAKSLQRDPGLRIMRSMLEEFRSSMIASTLQLTTRLLLLTLSESGVRRLLHDYWMEQTPLMFASSEAIAFRSFLSRRDVHVSYLDEVLDYEVSTLTALIEGRAQRVSFQHDPMTILRPLVEARLPHDCISGSYEIEIVPDGAPPNLNEEVLRAQPALH